MEKEPSLRELIESLPDDAKEELESIGNFHHYVVCRYVLLRKILGLMEVNIDERSAMIEAKTINDDLEPLITEYVTDSLYSEFYGVISGESHDAFIMPIYEEIEGKNTQEAGRALGVSTECITNAISALPEDVGVVSEGKVHFNREEYEKLKVWVEKIVQLDLTTYNMSLLGVQGFRYNIDGITDNTQILKLIMQDVDNIMTEIENRGISLQSIPLEAYYLWAFIGALENAMLKHLGMSAEEFEKRIMLEEHKKG